MTADPSVHIRSHYTSGLLRQAVVAPPPNCPSPSYAEGQDALQPPIARDPIGKDDAAHICHVDCLYMRIISLSSPPPVTSNLWPVGGIIRCAAMSFERESAHQATRGKQGEIKARGMICPKWIAIECSHGPTLLWCDRVSGDDPFISESSSGGGWMDGREGCPVHRCHHTNHCICANAKLRLLPSDPRFVQRWRHLQVQRALLCCRVELIYIYP